MLLFIASIIAVVNQSLFQQSSNLEALRQYIRGCAAYQYHISVQMNCWERLQHCWALCVRSFMLVWRHSPWCPPLCKLKPCPPWIYQVRSLFPRLCLASLPVCLVAEFDAHQSVPASGSAFESIPPSGNFQSVSAIAASGSGFQSVSAIPPSGNVQNGERKHRGSWFCRYWLLMTAYRQASTKPS